MVAKEGIERQLQNDPVITALTFGLFGHELPAQADGADSEGAEADCNGKQENPEETSDEPHAATSYHAWWCRSTEPSCPRSRVCVVRTGGGHVMKATCEHGNPNSGGCLSAASMGWGKCHCTKGTIRNPQKEVPCCVARAADAKRGVGFFVHGDDCAHRSPLKRKVAT